MRKTLFAALCLISSASVSATTIDFESYTDPTVLNSFADSGATFTGVGDTVDFEISAYSSITPSWGTAGPMVLCARGTEEYCGGSFAVDFASAVTDLQFYFSADDELTSLLVEAFLGSTSLGTLTFDGDADPFTAHLADLSSLGSIDRIVVTTPTGEFLGYVYDDFSFSGGVPEPGTWTTMLLGFGALGALMRRRRPFAQKLAT